MKSTRNPLVFAFLMVASLFFIWGFCHAMLDVLNKHFQNILNISRAQSGLVETSVFLPYLLLAFPAALMNRRIGYQRSILTGLVILATGAFLFIPAGLVFKTFWGFLGALFVLSTGLACIEVAANPYVTVLGPKDGAPGRLSVAQAFNSCAYIIAPTVGGFLLFGHKADAGAPVDFHTLILPYVVLGCVVLVIFGIFSCIKLPVIEGDNKTVEPDDSTMFKAPLSRLPHFKWGVFTQFLYIISQIGIGAFAVNYIVQNAVVKDASGTESVSPLFSWYGNLTHAASPDATAAYVISFAMVLYAIGRFTGAPIARVVKPNVLLALYGVVNAIIVLLAMADIKLVSWMVLPFSFLFMSIMFPFIFAMSLRNLGVQTKIAASFHVMAVGAAGSISAVLMGWLWDHYHSVMISFALPLVGFIATTIYGLAYPKLLEKSSRAV
ncbi:MAG TPA: MFS transporter [Candidatus Sulfotelmatobacter sp.]|jgi:FHS family L-fucose permease-like MFS transporter|nr:MFS transporter [Candidatus Sulfotelmatobacter sp.]